MALKEITFKCLDCAYFQWWDGDYVCLPPGGSWKVLTSDEGIFDDEVVRKLRRLYENCKQFKKSEGESLLNRFKTDSRSAG